MKKNKKLLQLNEVQIEPTPELQNLWNEVHRAMCKEFGAAIYQSWLKPLTLRAYYHGTMEVSAPTRFMRNWIHTHYADRITQMCAAANPDVKRVQIVVFQNAISDESIDSSEISLGNPERKVNQNLRQGFASISSPLDPRNTLGGFVVGKPNALAHAAALQVVEGMSTPFNPLFLYGRVGLGKTHLLQAIAGSMQEEWPKKRILYTTTEKFMHQFVKAVRANDTKNFKDLCHSVDVFIIDDIQFIADKDTIQEELHQMFIALIEQNKQIVISADKAPSDLSGFDKGLCSLFNFDMVVELLPYPYESRLDILKFKRQRLGAKVPDSVLEFLALKVTSNIRELEGALNRIVAHSEVAKQDITLETTQEVLQDLLRSHSRKITIDEIQRKVAEHYNLRVSDIRYPQKVQREAQPLQIAIYLARILTSRSLREIGRKFGGDAKDIEDIYKDVAKGRKLDKHLNSEILDFEKYFFLYRDDHQYTYEDKYDELLKNSDLYEMKSREIKRSLSKSNKQIENTQSMIAKNLDKIKQGKSEDV